MADRGRHCSNSAVDRCAFRVPGVRNEARVIGLWLQVAGEWAGTQGSTPDLPHGASI